MSKNVLWITRTATLTALLVVSQLMTSSLGNTLVTGSVVNFILIAAAMLCGLSSGITVAAISPIVAKLLGIGPLWELIPFIAAGNITLVLVWRLIGGRSFGKPQLAFAIAAIVAAAAKFAVLYISIVRVAVPILLSLPEKQAGVISATFSYPQIITALLGGMLAVITLPTLSKIFKQPVQD